MSWEVAAASIRSHGRVDQLAKAMLGILTTLCLGAAPSLEACGAPTEVKLVDDKRPVAVRRIGSAITFDSGLKVNTDGAANSYHPEGRGRSGALNTMCNALAVYPSSGPLKGMRVTAQRPQSISGAERCQMILDIYRASMKREWAIPAEGKIDWFAIASLPRKDGRYRPCIQKDGPFKGFFTAQTARAADPSRDVCDPARYVSSTQIPYITLPGGRLTKTGVNVGDLALVQRRVNGADFLIVAIAADSGNQNETGEGSIALHEALGNPGKRGALPGNFASGVTTFIFPGLKASRPITRASLASERDRLVQMVGGIEAVRSCAATGT